MTIKTHALLAALTTAAIVGLIYYRSTGDENARMKKAMAKAEAAAQAKKEAEAERAKAAAEQKAKAEAEKQAQAAKAAKEVPAEEKPVMPEEKAAKAETPKQPEKTAEAKPAKDAVPSVPAVATAPKKEEQVGDERFPAKNSVCRNGDFKKGLGEWRYWRLKEDEGKKLISKGESGLVIDGQSNTLMGVAQTVRVVSGTVYRISAKVRSLDYDPDKKEFMGARLAFNAPNQKEQQVVWMYKDPDWKEQSLIFTNRFSGQATFFFHTGYTKPAAKCEVTDIQFASAEPFIKSNECAVNGDFKSDYKGWNLWQIKAEEATGTISRVTKDGAPCILIKGREGGKLMGLAQAVNMTSGAVYRFSAAVKSQDGTPQAFFGARVALFAKDQKEQQLLWTYNTKDWETKDLIFTNNFKGAATLYFHTGYTTNACEAFFKNISLIKQ